MACPIGNDPSKRRKISDTSYQTTIEQQLIETVTHKMRRACLSLFTGQEAQLQTRIPLPLSPTRFERYLYETVQELNPFNERKDLTQAALESVAHNFKYPEMIESEDLCFSELKNEDYLMQKWSEETLRTTSHQIELKRKTRFEEIPLDRQKLSCFRYALERVGLKISKPIENPRILRKILSQFFIPVEELQEGDLILFSNGGKPTHLGIYYQGQVLSKEGNGAHVAYIRPIEDILMTYGSCCHYFRMSLSSI